MKHFEEYKPKEKGKSDFYSWNLYRWLRKQSKEKIDVLKKTKIYQDEDGILYIGSRYDKEEKNVSGFRLRALCSTGSNNKFPTVFWHPKSYKWKDVTDEFYAEYERIGVCAIHGDFAHEWKYSVAKTIRYCRHCKKREFKKVEMVERVYWESDNG